MQDLMPLFTTLFPTSPAVLRTSYVESAINDIRYSIGSESKFQSHFITQPLTSKDWLKDDMVLGPYEKSLIYEILDETLPIVAFRSGSGSGKSTIVNAIRERTQEICNFKKPDNDSWAQQTGLRTFFAVVSLQKSSKYSYKKSIGKRPSKKLLNNFYLWMAESIVKEFYKNISLNLKNERVLQHFLNDNQTENGECLHFRQLYANHTSGFVSHTKAQDRNTTLTLLRTKFSGRDAFTVALGILASSARQVRARESSAENDNFVLCLDNTDLLKPELLRHLLEELKSELEEDELKASGLKIVVFMRLTTSRDAIGALNNAQFKPLSSPDPLDVVIPKMLSFLFHSEEYENEFNSDTILQARARIVEFLVRLNDPIDRFDELLSAISGTNIRNYFVQLQKLLASDHFLPRFRNSVEFERFIPNIAEFAVDIIILRFFQKLSIAIDRSIGSIEHEEIDDRKLRLFCRAVAKDFVRSIASFALASEQGEIQIRERHLQSQALLEGTVERLSTGKHADNIFANPIFSRVLHSALESIDWKIHQLNFKNGNKPKSMESFFRLIVRSSKTEVDRQISNADRSKKEMVSQLVNCYISELRSYASREPGNEVVARPYYYPVRSRVRDIISKATKLNPNFLPNHRMTRFGIAQIILGKSAVHDESDFLPINIFSTNTTEYQPICLLILYYLGCGMRLHWKGEFVHSIRLGEIEKFCLDLGFTEDEFFEAISLLSSIDNRLIYSTVTDYEVLSYGGRKKLARNSVVYLSWAGWRYYDRLTENAHYLQWCAFRMRSLVVRVGAEQKRLGSGGVFDHLPELGVVPPGTQPGVAFPLLIDAFIDILLHMIEKRKMYPLDFNFSQVSDDDARRMIFINRFPEIDIFLKVAPDLVAVLNATAKGLISSGIEATIFQVVEKITRLVEIECAWASEEFGNRVKEWDEHMAAITIGANGD